jgi:hypothetical protein
MRPQRSPHAAAGLAVALAVASLAGACAPRTAQLGAPRPELEGQALQNVRPQGPVHVIFEWRLQERDARFHGQGVARVDAPRRARLDLFGPRGESYLVAMLTGAELRLPPGVPEGVVPPAELLWAAVGVFQPPPGAHLAGSDANGAVIRLGYERDGESWLYEIRDGRLYFVEYQDPAGRHTVELRGRAAEVPEQAHYRNWAHFRELLLTVTQVENVHGFDEEIWLPASAY